MHELSLVQGIIDLVTREAEKANSKVVESLDIDIGVLSGIEMDPFLFAWELSVPDTCLATAKPVINRIEGKAKCFECDNDFTLDTYSDPCPDCGGHLISIYQGKEFKVTSITVS